MPRRITTRMPCALALVIIASGCSEPEPKQPLLYDPTDTVQQRIDKALAFGAPRELAISFDNFPELVMQMEQAPELIVYRGVPRHSESDGRDEQASKTTTIDEFKFYASPVPLTNDVERQLRAMLANQDSFYPFFGYKSCGGFHPDWCLTWDGGEEPINVHLCFGCGELQAFADGKMTMYWEFGDQKKFEELLQPFATSRAGSPRRPN